MNKNSFFGRFAIRHALSISFITVALCLAGIYALFQMPSAVFPQTDFPRIIILVNNGITPTEEMMATVTRPIEEAMKEIPGAINVRSGTGRGSAEINVFFDWRADMVQSELFVLGRLAEIRAEVPATARTSVSRVTFSVFPIIGVSLTSLTRDISELWEKARYELKPRFLQIPGVASVDITGGKAPEYHVVVDPLRLAANHLALTDIAGALEKNNLISPAGMLEENYHFYLTTVDGRVHSVDDIENLIIAVNADHPVRIKDVAHVERGQEPAFKVVTADGRDAVLLNIESQPDGSTLDIAAEVQMKLQELRKELPPDMHLAFYYDQSTFVRESIRSVWEAIIFGLILSVAILFFFLKNWGSVLTAVLTIPITILITVIAMKLLHMSFNLMTLGGIAAAIGLVIDDAIVVVEAMCAKLAASRPRLDGIQEAIAELLRPLVASTLTPVVVFVPLAFLTGVAGVFFRALALTMVVALLTSLVLALTLTPSLATWFIQHRKEHVRSGTEEIEGGFLLRRVTRIYEKAVRMTLRFRWLTLLGCATLLVFGIFIYGKLESDFLPAFDEGGFVVDYWSPPGTSLAETSRQLAIAEKIIRENPDVESYSRRTGAELGPFLTEPNRGDFVIKLKTERNHSTEKVIAEFRHQFNAQIPALRWEFPGILGDLVGDLALTPDPIEIKIFSPDMEWLKRTAPRVKREIESVPGVVDAFDGLVETGPSIDLRVRVADAARFGFSTEQIAAIVNAALLGKTASSVLEGDRTVNIRVLVDPAKLDQISQLRDLPLRSPAGRLIQLSQVADVIEEPGQLERRREDLRQDVAITARLENRDLGSAMKEIREKLSADKSLAPGSIQFGGLYQQQQESFKNLLLVLLMAVALVFTVLLVEFRSFYEPIAIVFGAILAMFGTVLALWITGTSLNIVSFLGAIIGIGIVAKNGILMLDFVEHLRAEGLSLTEALMHSGRRRLRPVLMTSLAAALGMLPLAYGIGSGADMLKPLAIAVIGALGISVLLSLVATPTVYYLMLQISNKVGGN